MKKTISVGELIAALEGVANTNLKGRSLPVFAEWEGVHAPIKTKNISLIEGTIVIDVNEYWS